jgi:hypothetical protein
VFAAVDAAHSKDLIEATCDTGDLLGILELLNTYRRVAMSLQQAAQDSPARQGFRIMPPELTDETHAAP